MTIKTQHIHIRRQGNFLWLILDRPPLNILTIEMLDQLTAAMRDAIKQTPRLVVITGTGERAFCAGVDIHDHLDGREMEMLRAVRDNFAAFEELRAHNIPSVALVKGYALGGGCELAALCDTVIAHEHASWLARGEPWRLSTCCRRLLSRAHWLQCHLATHAHWRNDQSRRSITPGPCSPGSSFSSLPPRCRRAACCAGCANLSNPLRLFYQEVLQTGLVNIPPSDPFHPH